MESAGGNQTTASTSAPSYLHVLKGQTQSQAGVNSNSNSNCQEKVGGQGIAHNNEIRRLQSASPSTLPLPGEFVLGSQPEFWPVLGQAPAPTPSPSSSSSVSTSTTFPIPSSAIQDRRASDVVGNTVSHNVAISQGSETNHQVPRGRNAPNRPFFPRGSETNGYLPPGRNLPKKSFFSLGSETKGYVPPGRNAPNRPYFSQGSETKGYVSSGRNGPNRPVFTHGSETNGYLPLGINASDRSFFFPKHSMDQFYRGHEYPPREGYGNMHNEMHEQTEYNWNWNSEKAFHGINNVAMYQQFGPTNNMRQPPLPQIPVVDGVTNHFYMNAAPMPTYYFPQPIYLDDSSGGPYLMPPPPSVPTIAQINVDLRKRIVKQADFYFSTDNLCKDTYLRSHMDEHGWVDISVIAGFRRMRQLTYDVNLILDALGESTVVEIQGDKIRRRNDWFLWPNPVFIVGIPKQGHMDGSSSSETASELGTSERVFPERDKSEDMLDPKKDDKVLV